MQMQRQRQRQRQGRAGQGRKARDNSKANASGNTGYSALRENGKGMIDCGTGWRAGQNERQGGEKGRILR